MERKGEKGRYTKAYVLLESDEKEVFRVLGCRQSRVSKAKSVVKIHPSKSTLASKKVSKQ